MKINKKLFSLIELIVVMGVFAILLLLTSVIFSTAQKTWTKSGNNTTTFENVRIALEIMSRDIQSIYNKQNKIPFWYKTQSGNDEFSNESINFVAKTELPPEGATSNLCEIRYQLYHTNDLTNENAGYLMRSVTGNKLSNGSNNSKWNFYNNITADLTGADNAFTANNDSGEPYQKLIPYVTGLSFVCYTEPNESDEEIEGTTSINSETNELPFSIEIEISLLDKDIWNKWIAISNNTIPENSEAKAFRKKYERTFTKTVLIGNRGQYQ